MRRNNFWFHLQKWGLKSNEKLIKLKIIHVKSAEFNFSNLTFRIHKRSKKKSKKLSNKDAQKFTATL